MRERLRELRLRSGLTQGDLSERAGLHKSHVGLIESGHIKAVGSSAAVGLSRALGCSLDYLLRGVGAPPSDEAMTAALEASRLGGGTQDKGAA